ncbi:DRC6-like protein, partial [Mya arenaria]
MAASMKGLDPVLKRYLRSNKLPDVYEALITGLAVMCPEDPHQFIIDNLKYLIEFGTDGLEWDLFVEEFMKPLNKVVSESNLEFIFNMDDESMLRIVPDIDEEEGPIPKRILHLLQILFSYFKFVLDPFRASSFIYIVTIVSSSGFSNRQVSFDLQPTPEMYEKAYLHYNTNSWMQYYLRKKRKRLDMEEKMTRATTFHSHRTLKLYLDEWIEWVKYRKGRQAMAYQKISHVLNVSIGRVIFEAWHSHTLDARRQREYFERLERGENMEDDDAFGQGTGEARDSISNLPRKVAIQVTCNMVTDKVVTKLLYKCRPYLIHLNMRGCMFISEPSFISISECSNLQDLNFSECTGLNDEHLKLVAKGCKILLYLNISHTLVTDASLRTIAKNCSNLQYLSMAHCKKFTDRGLLYLSAGKNSKKLDYIDLSGCLQITPDGFKNLSNGCTNLQTLLLNDFPTLSDDCLFPVAAKLTKISTLSLLGSPNLSDEAFKRIASNKNLKKIKIEGNQRISDASLKQIGQSCVNLEHIYIADCQRLTDLALKALAPCKHLAVANFADCVRVGEKGVRALVEGPCGPRLREFNLTNCICVNDMTMVHIHKRCHNLTYLSLCFCEHLSEAGIELIGQIHSLTSVDISGCNCGDQGLAALGNNSRRDVTLSECVNITDLGLQKFAQQCKNIERLDLSHCMQITDGAIKNLAFCCRMLNVLNLAGCKLVTDLSIQYLSGVCHYLVQLDVSGCLLITDKALKYLRKGCKKLSLLILLY